MAIRRVNGGWQADVSDKRRGIARTKRTFRTKKEASEWERAVLEQGHRRLLGVRDRRLFGEALAQYLQETQERASHGDNLSNAMTLRYPVPDGRRWIRLEQVPLDDGPDGIIAALSKWVADMKMIQRRAYISNRFYQLRPAEGDRLAWYHQPHPADGDQPQPRYEVTDPAVLVRLERTMGRGPFASNTLRIRQVLVAQVLKRAWKSWRWLDQDISGLIHYEAGSKHVEADLTYDQLLSLLIHADVGIDAAILAGAWIGWRRGNIIGRKQTTQKEAREGLRWSRVVFPVYQSDPVTGAQELVQPGYFWTGGNETKNGKPLVQPMSERVEQLLRFMWDHRNGDQVFHNNGRMWGDFRKRYARAKQAAGIPASFRWHDLRHVWASEMARSNVNDRQLQILGGWLTDHMPKRYAHLRPTDQVLIDAANAPSRVRGRRDD